jgi:hypothetical protein
MSLGRLLSAGKSLVGLSSASRYQLRTGTLPKFESLKNPFAPKSQEESVEPEAPSENLSPAEMAAAHLKKTQRLPLLVPKPEVKGESLELGRPELEAPVLPKGGTPNLSSPPEPCAPPQPIPLSRSAEGEGENPPVEVTAPVNSWLKKLNPLVWFANRKPTEPKSAIPRFNKAPVQGELSLDNIKVMRNDLSDADVEVVPKKALSMETIALSGQATAAAAMAIPELPPATNAWEFLGERLLRQE